ncbi:sulfate transporter CysZ, partial [Marinomonas sp.]|nr:sulfate transporter CysZ [Marinomonas sp.]
MVTQPFKAVSAFIEAVPLALSKNLRWFILVPLLANIALMGLIYVIALSLFQSLLADIMGYLPEWMSFLHWFFNLIFGAIVSVLLFFSFSVGVNI